MATEINIRPSHQSEVLSQAIGSVPEMLLQFQRARQDKALANQADARAERQMIMQEARFENQERIQNQVENTERALKKWSNSGYRWDLLEEDNTKALYASNLPSDAEQWAGYDTEMRSLGSSASQERFFDSKKANDQRYMNQVFNRWYVDAKRLLSMNNNHSKSDFEKKELLDEFFNTENVFKNYANAFSAEKATHLFGQFDYKMGSHPSLSILQKIGNFIGHDNLETQESSSPITTSGKILQQAGNISDAVDQQTGFNPKAAAVPVGLALAETLRRSYSSSIADATKPILKDINKAWQPPSKGGLNAKEFLDKFRMRKGDASTDKKTFKASKDIMKKARRMAGPGVWAGAKSIPAYLASIEGGGLVGSEVGSMFGDKGEKIGKEAGRIGGTVAAPALKNAMTNVYKKIQQKGLPWALKKIATKGGPKLAMKMLGKGAIGAMGAPFSGGTSAMFMGGLIAKDIYDIADILLTEE